ncbi:WD domain, G-beta repeat [Musa troglodytarum]|uniref:WD domain, G-beta repeat n=1 Tax=Musa troglodytarum TaxID=320322 RepID=A0A9E7EIK3_9LILI|nr:WD domain, G-beta repeat [Musa troglodytarum]
MSPPLMRLRDREWHSPASQRFVDQGDRFIPTRSLMNLDFARSSLMRQPRRAGATVDLPEILTPKEEYRRRVEENWTLDSQGKPLKMLVFRGSPRKSHPSVLMVDEMLKEEREPPRSIRRIRHLPQSADRILDGPELIDDYYLNLMGWGKSNILAVALGRSLYLWNAAGSTVQLLLTTDADDHPTSVAWSVDGKMVAVGFASSKVEIWDAVALQQVRILEGHLARVGSLSWTWNMLSSGSRDASIINHDGTVLLLLLRSSVQKTKGTNAIVCAVRSFRRVSSKLRAHTGEVCGLKWSCGGDLLASGGNDNLVHVWESSKMGSSKYLHRLTDHRAAVRALAWCPFQPKTLASGGGTADQCIKIWNAQTGRCANSINTCAQARRSRTQTAWHDVDAV